MGQYRSFSQFRSRPIIWLNPNLKSIVEDNEREIYGDDFIPAVVERETFVAAVHTIIHEYGHVIAEYLRCRTEIWHEVLRQFDDEEDFAEGFIEYVNYQIDSRYKKVIRIFIESAFEKE